MYEIGDKVIYQGADKNAYKRVGVVKSIEEKDGKPQLTVELDGGETFTAPIDDWSREFSNACRNAKFKIGDRVRITQKAADFIDNPALARKRGTVKKVLPGGYYEVDGDLGATGLELSDNELELAYNSRTSTNSVVRNAMAANKRVARNARTDWEMEIYKLTEKIKQLVAKSQRENGENYPTDVFKEALKAMRGY